MRGLLAAVVTATSMAAALAQGVEWRGAGWYQVVETPAGLRLQAGPYVSELACKKAMNSSVDGWSCRELPSAPRSG